MEEIELHQNSILLNVHMNLVFRQFFICQTMNKGGEDDNAKKLTMQCSKVYGCVCFGSISAMYSRNGTRSSSRVYKPVDNRRLQRRM